MKSFSSFLLTEGIHDPAKLKAIFLAGGPGSGKSYVASKTTRGLGFKEVNSDDLFERKLKQRGLSSTPENIYSKEGQDIRNKAKYLTQKRQHHYVNGRLGLVIDGTGKDPDKIKEHSNRLRRLGYDTHMVFVNTSLETAKRRNNARPRSLPDEKVEQMHSQVQNNIGHFQHHFGGDNFHVVDNNNENENERELHSVHKKIRQIASREVKNPVGRKWIRDNSRG